MLYFKDCTLEILDETFSLKEITALQALTNWLNHEASCSDFEKEMLNRLKKRVHFGYRDWNEAELLQHVIAPLFTLVDFSNEKHMLFSERKFEGVVDGTAMSGKPDGIIASGRRSPKKPYFCFQEYKRFKNPDGDPAGQCLAAMLVAQEINEYKHPIYGCHVIGNAWYFMVLEGKIYSISTGHFATRDDIFDIFLILKSLKAIIIELTTESQS